MLLILQLDKELRRKQSNPNQIREKDWGRVWTPRRGPTQEPCFESGTLSSTSAGFGHMFCKVRTLTNHFGRNENSLSLNRKLFFQNVPLNKAVEVFTSVHCTTAAKTSHDIVQLTFGFPPCVVRWQTSLELMEFYHSQGKCYTVYFIH